MKNIVLLLTVLMFSCTTEPIRKNKSFKIASINNKGVILRKIHSANDNVSLVIKTNEDVISEYIGNYNREPTYTVFNMLIVGDTIK